LMLLSPEATGWFKPKLSQIANRIDVTALERCQTAFPSDLLP